MLLDPTGSYVYVANKGSNNISGFTLTLASGKLTAISGSPFSSGGQLPIALVNDNSKKYRGGYQFRGERFRRQQRLAVF